MSRDLHRWLNARRGVLPQPLVDYAERAILAFRHFDPYGWANSAAYRKTIMGAGAAFVNEHEAYLSKERGSFSAA